MMPDRAHDGGEPTKARWHERGRSHRRAGDRRPARDRLRRRQLAVRGRGRRDAAGPSRRAVCAARLGRSGAGRGLSASLDRGRPDRPLVPPCPAAKAAATWCSSAALVRPTAGAVAPRLRRRCACCRGSPACFAAATTTSFAASSTSSRSADFDVLGAHEVAPRNPDAGGRAGPAAAERRDRADIARGLEFLRRDRRRSTSARRVVVAQNRVLGVEAAEGTDQMLARIAELRRRAASASRPAPACWSRRPSRARTAASICRRSARRPSRAPRNAGLAGIAVVAGERASWPSRERVAEMADRRGPVRRRRARRRRPPR